MALFWHFFLVLGQRRDWHPINLRSWKHDLQSQQSPLFIYLFKAAIGFQNVWGRVRKGYDTEAMMLGVDRSDISFHDQTWSLWLRFSRLLALDFILQISQRACKVNSNGCFKTHVFSYLWVGKMAANPLHSWSVSLQNQLQCWHYECLYTIPLLSVVQHFLFLENIFHLPTPMLAMLVNLKGPFIFQKLSHCTDI